MSIVKEVTDASFDEEVLRSPRPTIVDFWAEWCGRCKRLSPVMDQLANEYSEQIDVVKIEVDQNPEVAGRYRIISIPAVYVFEGGEVVATSTGVKPKQVLEQEFARFLGRSE